MRLLLMGNPNVGKSVVFNRLTGVAVISSNYPGTTVEYSSGTTKIGDIKAQVLDAPGTYSLDPTCKAEEVALGLLDNVFDSDDGDVVVNVVDATNLERSLNLTLQLIKRRVPMVFCLNFWDETAHIGVQIDKDRLAAILGVPIVTTCAITGEGIKDLAEAVPHARVSPYDFPDEERWNKVGKILEQVQKIEHKHHTFLERLGDASVRPLTALPIALVVCAVAFLMVHYIGESLINYVMDPLFDNFWTPVINQLSSALGGGGFIHEILIGRIEPDGTIDFLDAMGLLTSGVYIPLGAVFPYVFAFYFVLSILEDTGYLPRLAVFMDTFMHRLGMHGMTVVPLILGLGCNVPAALSCRILETRRERFIASTIVSICVPCMSQTAMVAGLAGGVTGGPWMGLIVFGTIGFTLLITAATLGYLSNIFIKGESTELLIDIPPYRIPYFKGLFKKVFMRLWWFLKEALPWVIFGVFLVNILYVLGIIGFIGRLAAPLVENLLGLPGETVGGLVVGFLRKDVAVGMLKPLLEDWKDVIVASVVLTMYFPCIATFTVLLKEFGIKDMLKASGIMVGTALFVGTVLNLVLHLF